MGLTVVLDAGAACGGNVMPESRFPGRQIGLRTVSNRASSPAPAPVVIGANLAGHYPGFRFWTPGSCSVYTQPPSPASPGWRRGRRRGISHTLKRRAYVRGRKPGDGRMRPRGDGPGPEGTPVFGRRMEPALGRIRCLSPGLRSDSPGRRPPPSYAIKEIAAQPSTTLRVLAASYGVVGGLTCVA